MVFTNLNHVVTTRPNTQVDEPCLDKSEFILLIMTVLMFNDRQCFPRYCDVLFYGLRSLVAGFRKQRIKQDSLYRKMLDEDGDASLLRLFYCVINSAPQAVLQLTILLYRTIERVKECTTAQSILEGDKCHNHTFGKFPVYFIDILHRVR